jgi:hypothetical protein
MRSTTRWAFRLLGLVSALGVATACSTKEGAQSNAGGDGGSGSGDGSTSPVSDAGALDGAPATALPPLVPLTNVVTTEREDSVGIDFDPVDNAVDYRVYPLPADGDITVNANGSVTVKNAIYRCAGLRQTDNVPNNVNSINTGNGVYPTSDAGIVFSSVYPAITTQISPSPTLGYVYVGPASDRVPVYAVGVHPSGGEAGWRESRPKIYTTDSSVRQTLLGQGGRDDGVVFYVPSTASSATQAIYHSETVAPVQNWTQYTEYYFASADVPSHAKDTTPPALAFPVLAAAAAGTQPLMAVMYQPTQQHVELAVGNARYARAANQGVGPLWHLEWSGLTKTTTLVVEALASGCPYQGFLSPEHLDAPPHQVFYTLADLQGASPTGEVYINGEYDVFSPADAGSPLLQTPNASPVPIARSFVQVTPQPHSPGDWDWYQGFNVGTTFGPVSASPDPKYETDTASGHWTSPDFDFGAYSVDNPNSILVFTYGQVLGQFWDAFDDWKQDVTGRVRWTAETKATIDPDPTKFLHVTWSVNTVSTGRRYPQLIVTDQGAPIEDGFQNANGNFLIIQTIQGPSMRLEVEAFHGLINGNPWAVNNQAPDHALVDYDDWNNGTNSNATLPPADPPLEHAGMDRMTKYDAYVSSGLLYVFMDGAPAGCTKYPANGFALGGAVTVTFGDVLYHEGAETEVGSCVAGTPTALPFLLHHQCTETKRQWDDLGFKSGAAAPTWDETTFPCVAY